MFGCRKTRRSQPPTKLPPSRKRSFVRSSGEYSKEHSESGEVLQSLTTFVGGGGPRFWFSVSPELQQLNYAQIIIQVKDKHDTAHLVGSAADGAVGPSARRTHRRAATGIRQGCGTAGRDPAFRGGPADSARLCGTAKAISEETGLRNVCGMIGATRVSPFISRPIPIARILPG